MNRFVGKNNNISYKMNHLSVDFPIKKMMENFGQIKKEYSLTATDLRKKERGKHTVAH
jgi:hypothetical protein